MSIIPTDNLEYFKVKYYFCELYEIVAYHIGNPSQNSNISKKIINYTLEMINSFTDMEHLDLYMDIYPNPHGTLSFDVENDLKDRIAIELGEDTFSYYVSEIDSDVIFKEKMNYHYDNIIELKGFIKRLSYKQKK